MSVTNASGYTFACASHPINILYSSDGVDETQTEFFPEQVLLSDRLLS